MLVFWEVGGGVSHIFFMTKEEQDQRLNFSVFDWKEKCPHGKWHHMQ